MGRRAAGCTECPIICGGEVRKSHIDLAIATCRVVVISIADTELYSFKPEYKRW
jgi:aldehyde:ferredoxin oxidoreductase